MPDIETTAKNNGPLAGMFGLVVLLAGTGIWSESGEEAQINDMAEELHQADIIQNQRHDGLEVSMRARYDELKDKFHYLDKELSLIKLRLELTE